MNAHCQHHADFQAPVSALSRRGALKLSLGSTLAALLGPTLPRAFGAEENKQAANDKSVILLWLWGGPFQQDTFDPKEATDEKLAFKHKPIATSGDGVRLAASMPKLAEQGRHLTLIRSMRGVEMEHSLAQFYMQTGYRSTGPIQAPAFGSIVSHELGEVPMGRADRDGLPAYISIDDPGYSSGYFGPAYKPYLVWDPNAGPANLGLPGGTSAEEHARRLEILKSLEAGRPATSAGKRSAAARETALAFMGSSRRSSFDLNQEPGEVRDRYGRSHFGQGCLLARRLVESGVRFVQVKLANFDLHDNHQDKHDQLVGTLDTGMASLIADLEERKLLDNTIVIAVGEFGRTPEMNDKKGRDHWIEGFSVALAGGGFQRGFVYGSTTDDGREIREDAVTVPDLLATLCHDLGIDHEKEYIDQFARPIKLVDDGTVIDELLA